MLNKIKKEEEEELLKQNKQEAIERYEHYNNLQKVDK